MIFTEASAEGASLSRGLGACSSEKILKSRVISEMLFSALSTTDISSKNKFEASIKSHVFSVLTSDIAEIF